MPTIDVNGETLSYLREGSGPPLVLMHSLGTNSALWTAQIAHWAPRFECLAFDARGHGGSSNNGGVSMANVAADLQAALEALGLLPAHFIGISMGGLIGARLHERDPAALASAVIADSFHTLGDLGPERVTLLDGRLADLSMEAYGRIYAEETLRSDVPEATRAALAAAIAGVDKESYLQTARSVFTENVVDCMQAMAIPVRVVVGEQDDRTPPALSEAIAQLVPGADLVTVPNAKHLANIDNPDGFPGSTRPSSSMPTTATAMP